MLKSTAVAGLVTVILLSSVAAKASDLAQSALAQNERIVLDVIQAINEGLHEHMRKVELRNLIDPEPSVALNRLQSRLQAIQERVAVLDGPNQQVLIRKARALAQLLQAETHSLGKRKGEARSLFDESAYPKTCEQAFPLSSGAYSTRMSDKEVWLQYLPTETGVLTIDTLGSDFDTVISVFKSCETGSSNLVGTSDDAFGLQSMISLRTHQSEEILVRVSGFAGSRGALTVTFKGNEGGSISGSIMSSETGNPISGISVAAVDENGRGAGFSQTAQDGSYIIGNIEPGVYYVYTHSSDGLLEEAFDDIPYAYRCTHCLSKIADPVSVTEGEVTNGVDFELSLGGIIAGRVRDRESGTPVESGFVSVVSESSGFNIHAFTGTDSLGRYRITGLPSDVFYISARGDEHTLRIYDDIPCFYGFLPSCFFFDDATPIQATRDQTVNNIDFALNRWGAISGTVTDSSTSEPIPFVLVRAEGIERPSLRGSKYTDENGSYRIGGLQAINYRVKVDSSDHVEEVYDNIPCTLELSDFDACEPQAGTPVSVDLDAVTHGIDFALDPRGTIAGTVLDGTTGAPLEGQRIVIWDSEGSSKDVKFVNETGFFESRKLLPGTYFVTTLTNTHINELYQKFDCSDECDVTSGTPVIVEAGTQTSVDFALRRRGSIRVAVIDASTETAIQGIDVELWDAVGRRVRFDRTNEAGLRWFGNLPDGTYFVSTIFRAALAGQGLYLDQLFDGIPCPGGANNGCNPEAGTPIAVTANQTLEVQIRLNPLAGVAGEIRQSVTLSPIVGAAVDVWDSTGSYVSTAVTDETGLYAAALVPGDYYFSTDNGLGFQDEIYNDISCPLGPAFFNLCEVLVGQIVAVSEGPVTMGINFELIPTEVADVILSATNELSD